MPESQDLVPVVHLRDPNTGEVLAVVPADEVDGWKVRLEQRQKRMPFKEPKWPDKPLERGSRGGTEVFGPEVKPKRPRGPWDAGWVNPKGA